MQSLRIDKWLWAARFYKTRSLASNELQSGRVRLNGQPAKPARDVHVGDTIELRQGAVERTVMVAGLSAMRGPAPVAQLLYAETPESVAKRQIAAQQQREQPEPAKSREAGRPTKRERRALDEQVGGQLNGRWSATWPQAD